ncbi:putative pentatricopeptide repeat-containing protein At3g16710, mitochondrial [Prosopis cineraria]|uniref:putative pentatricopeptide repeat-containing protein At3g16710, mitochondrial n=1 Tax=Prosopis cineraria TaxID=364024 RepID=UPI00240FF310|nr:putative pentatricopeptide repeat-containing protein At3g16710, mitochondrial [Prosopis cineraria]
MASQFLVPALFFQSRLQTVASHSPLFMNLNSRSNYDGHSIAIRAGKQLSLHINTSNPAENSLKYGLNLDEISFSHTEMEMKDFRFKSLVNRIRFLSSNSKNEKIDLDEAERVLGSMLENGFQPDAETLTILVNSFCKRGRMKKAVEIFDLMNRIGTKPTIQTYNCLLKGLCYVGKVEEAYEMLMKMKKMKIPLKPDIYSYTAVMDGLCKVGRSDEARELLDEAEELMGLKPNVITFNTLFQGYSREGRPLEAISVLKLMKKKNCVPDYISYATLLHGLLKWNQIRDALKIYKEMERFGFEVDARMMGTLVRRLCRESRKEKGMLEDACQVFEKMTRRDSIVVDQRTHEVMIQALCARGRTEEAVSTLLLMDENGRIPSGLCFDALIKELNAQGRLLGHPDLFGYAMKRGGVQVNSFV